MGAGVTRHRIIALLGGAPTGVPGAVNPTSTFLPYNSAGSFADSLLSQPSTTKISLIATQNSSTLLNVTNAQLGTAALSGIEFSNNTVNTAKIEYVSSGFTTGGINPSLSGLTISNSGSGGVTIAGTNAGGGLIRFYAQGTALSAAFYDSGLAIGSTAIATSTHIISAIRTQNSTLDFNISNINAGTLATSSMLFNNGTTSLLISKNGSGFTTLDQNFQNGSSITDNGAGGISVASTNAAGVVRFYTGGTALRWTIGTTGHLLGAAGSNIQTDTVTGMKIWDTNTQKGSFWGAATIAQPTTAIAAATFVANTSLIANDTATFDGYTIGQVVKALRNSGLLA